MDNAKNNIGRLLETSSINDPHGFKTTLLKYTFHALCFQSKEDHKVRSRENTTKGKYIQAKDSRMSELFILITRTGHGVQGHSAVDKV